MAKIRMHRIGCFVFIVFIILLILPLFYNSDLTKLGNGFIYDDERKDIIGQKDIPPKIISYSYDSQFVIVKQRPEEYDNAMYPNYTYPMGRDTIYYWLIIKKEKKVIGPLDFNQFQHQRKYYKVTDELTFD